MRSHHVEVTLTTDGTITLLDLPFQAGARVTVAITEMEPAAVPDARVVVDDDGEEMNSWDAAL